MTLRSPHEIHEADVNAIQELIAGCGSDDGAERENAWRPRSLLLRSRRFHRSHEARILPEVRRPETSNPGPMEP